MIFGDSAYAGPDTIDDLNEAGYEVIAKVPPATNRDGRYTKDDFAVDLGRGHGDLPGRGDRRHPAGRRRRGARRVRRGLRRLPAAGALHRLARRAARSASTAGRRSCSGPSGSRPPPNGRTPTARSAPGWNARSPTSCGPPGAADEREPGADNASPPTPSPAPPPSTGRAWPPSAWPSPTAAGRSPAT